MVTRRFSPELTRHAYPAGWMLMWWPMQAGLDCHLVPLWSAILGKDDIKAFQASERTGVLYTKIRGSRVELAGKAALYSIGELVFPLEVK